MSSKKKPKNMTLKQQVSFLVDVMEGTYLPHIKTQTQTLLDTLKRVDELEKRIELLESEEVNPNALD